jgi:hypothetical protein
MFEGIGLIALTAFVVWELIWKGIAMWYAAKNDHKVWYIVILIFNTLGILPIVYILFFRKRR